MARSLAACQSWVTEHAIAECAEELRAARGCLNKDMAHIIEELNNTIRQVSDLSKEVTDVNKALREATQRNEALTKQVDDLTVLIAAQAAEHGEHLPTNDKTKEKAVKSKATADGVNEKEIFKILGHGTTTDDCDDDKGDPEVLVPETSTQEVSETTENYE